MTAVSQDHGRHARVSSPGNFGPFSSAATSTYAGDSGTHAIAEALATLPVLGECEAAYWGGKVVCDDNDDYSDDEQRTAHVRKAVDDIHELYRAGVPFFSKAAIQALVDQFDRTNDLIRREGRTAAVERERFFLRGLDGKEVRLRMETGVAHEIRNERWESFKMDPMLSYECYQHLTGDHAFMWNSKLVYCPLKILYRIHLQDSRSKASITLDEAQNLHRHNGRYPAEDTVRRQFGTCVADWEGNNELRRQLESALEKVSLPVVTKIVAFACATISDEEMLGPRLQHVLLLGLKRILEARQRQNRTRKQDSDADSDTTLRALETTSSAAGPTMPIATPLSIQCFAQDPVYTNVDKVVLAEHGVTVVDDPRGFLQVDDQSAVLSFAPNICVRQIVADIARPALLIWNTVHDEEETMSFWRNRFGDSRKVETLHELEGSLTDPESPRLRDMIRNEYTEVMKIKRDDIGSDVSIYVRKSGGLTQA